MLFRICYISAIAILAYNYNKIKRLARSVTSADIFYFEFLKTGSREFQYPKLYNVELGVRKVINIVHKVKIIC